MMAELKPFTDSDLPLPLIHEYRISGKYKVFYFFVIIVAILALMSMPFIKIPVSAAEGLVRVGPVNYEVFAPGCDKGIEVLMRGNRKLCRVDTLLPLEAD